MSSTELAENGGNVEPAKKDDRKRGFFVESSCSFSKSFQS